MGERAVVAPDAGKVIGAPISEDVLYGRDALERDVPYVVPEALAHLEQVARPWWRVFEWGAGGSTVWFANRCREVVSVEPRLNWVERLSPKLAPFTNVKLVHEPDLGRHADLIGNFVGPFDLVFVDGERQVREACVRAAVPRVKPGGVLMIDNSDLEEGRGVLPDWPATHYRIEGLRWVGMPDAFNWQTSFFARPYYPAEALRQVAPELFAPTDALAPFERRRRPILYVGASPHRMDCLPELAGVRENRITVVEVWRENVAWLRLNCPGLTVVEEDVRELDVYDDQFEAAVWWHGPEHVEKGAELNGAIERLERAARLVVLAAPWGRCPQGEYAGNPHEAHRWNVYPSDLEAMGYEVERFGDPDAPPRSFLVARKGAIG